MREDYATTCGKNNIKTVVDGALILSLLCNELITGGHTSMIVLEKNSIIPGPGNSLKTERALIVLEFDVRGS